MRGRGDFDSKPKPLPERATNRHQQQQTFSSSNPSTTQSREGGPSFALCACGGESLHDDARFARRDPHSWRIVPINRSKGSPDLVAGVVSSPLIGYARGSTTAQRHHARLSRKCSHAFSCCWITPASRLGGGCRRRRLHSQQSIDRSQLAALRRSRGQRSPTHQTAWKQQGFWQLVVGGSGMARHGCRQPSRRAGTGRDAACVAL